jgi:hypothetical protein
LGPFEITGERHLVADVSTLIFNKNIKLLSSGIMMSNNDEYGLQSLHKSFSPQVWIMIFISFLYVLLIFSLIELRKKSSSLNSIKMGAFHLYKIISKNLWNYLGHLFKQSNYKNF